MEEISKIICDNVKKLDINDEDKHIKYLEESMSTIVKFSIENSYVPLLTFMTCPCGCGTILHLGNLDILSKQKTPDFLEAAAKQMREENKKLN